MAGADFAKGTRFREGGGAQTSPGAADRQPWAQWCRKRSLPHFVLRPLLWLQRLLAALPESMNVDCTGFEVETLINIRIARAGLDIHEVPSFERERMHGQSNLRTFRDGGRVLRTILRERVRRTPLSTDEELTGVKSCRRSCLTGTGGVGMTPGS